MSGVLGVLLGSNGAAASGDAAETTAFLARTSGLDASHTNAYKALINSLVSDGIFAKLDALYVLATADSTTAKLNLVSTSYPLTNVGTPTFTTDRGFTGSPSDCLDTSINIAATTQFTINSAHLSVWIITAGSNGSAQEHGCFDDNFDKGSAYITSNRAGAGAAANITGIATGDLTVTPSAATGFFVGNRSAAGARQLYEAGASIGTDTTASLSPLTALSLYIGGRHINSGLNSGSDDLVGAYGVGSSLTGGEVANYYARLHLYMQTIAGVA